MKVAYINLRTGVYDQYHHLLEFLQSEENVCILCCAESKISIKEEIPQIEGFSSFSLNPAKLVIYVRNHVGLRVVPICEGMPAFAVIGRQTTVLCMYSEFTKKGIAGSYRVTDRQRLEFIKATYYAYDKMQYKRSMCVGDLNFCRFDENKKEAKELTRFFEERGFENRVFQYTRLKVREENDRNGALDHMYVRDMPGRLKIIPFSDSDHDLLLWDIPSNKKIRKAKKKITICSPTEKSEKFKKENALDALSSYAEKQGESLEKNYADLRDWCLEYKKCKERSFYKNDLDVPWWNPMLSELKKVMRLACDWRERWYHKRKYKYYFKYFHKLWVQKKYRNSKNPFFKTKGSVCEKLVVDGREVTDKVEICDHILDHYIGKIEKSMKESKPNWGYIVEAVTEWAETSNDHNIPRDEMGMVKIWDIEVPNRAEVQQLLREIAAKKSSGQSGVSLELLKEVEGEILDTLTIIIQKSIATGKFAQPWHELVGVPILKASKPSTDKASYRVVGLENEIVKCISYWIAKRVSRRLENYKIFDDKMHGFRSGFSISSFNEQVVEQILEAKEANMMSTAVLTDMQSAYDVLECSFLLAVLKALGAGPRLIGWLRTLYSEKMITIKCGGEQADRRPYTFRLIQGNSFSTLGFNLCVFPIRLFARGDIKAYADDLLLQITSKRVDDHLEKIEREYFEFEKYVADIGMKSCREKLQACTWAKKIPEEMKEFDLAGERIKDEPSVRILGIKLNKTLNFSEFIGDITAKVRQRAGQIRLKGKYLPTQAKLLLYEGWVMGKVQFGLDIYSKFLNCEQLEELERACNYAFRAACGLFRRSTECLTHIRARYQKPSFYQVIRDRVEKVTFKKLQVFREKDKNIRNITRAAKAGEVKKYNHLHKHSLERFQRQAINEWRLYKFESEKELKYAQKLRRKYEFRNRIHLRPNAKAFSRLDFKAKECRVEKQKVNKLSAGREVLPPKGQQQRKPEAKSLAEFLSSHDFQKFKENQRKMGKKSNNV